MDDLKNENKRLKKELRAANKGAERNAWIAQELAIQLVELCKYEDYCREGEVAMEVDRLQREAAARLKQIEGVVEEMERMNHLVSIPEQERRAISNLAGILRRL